MKTKSLELAKLMGWYVNEHNEVEIGEEGAEPLSPYGSARHSQAQFAAILLKFPKVLMRFAYDNDACKWLDAEDGKLFHGIPTQETILDNLLIMQRVHSHD